MCDRCWKQTHLPTAGMLSRTDTSDVHHTNKQQYLVNILLKMHSIKLIYNSVGERREWTNQLDFFLFLMAL